MQILQKFALQLPETKATGACVKTAYQAGKKTFLFLGMDELSYNVMLKLGDSLVQATQLAKQYPNQYKVGVHGWVTAVFNHADSPPSELFEHWINESYRLLAPKARKAGTKS